MRNRMAETPSPELSVPPNPPINGQQLTASRFRFDEHRRKIRRNELSHGLEDPVGEGPSPRGRARSATQLVREFFRLIAPYRREVFWILASLVVATVIGSYPNQWEDEQPTAYALVEAQGTWVTPEALEMYGPPMLELWVPDDLADGLTEAIRRDVAGALAGVQADVFRLDSPGYDVVDGAIRWVVLGVSVIALLLGGLGLVNIALVTVRYRIREIGSRPRSRCCPARSSSSGVNARTSRRFRRRITSNSSSTSAKGASAYRSFAAQRSWS